MYRKIGIAGLVLGLLLMIIGCFLPLGDFGSVLAMVSIPLTVIGFFFMQNAAQWDAAAKRDRNAETLLRFGSMDRENGVFTLYRRGPELASILKIKDDQNAFVTYTPVKIHVGAVSVGGVTTGGVYTTGGDRVYNSYSSGYYTLEVDGAMVRTIALTDELYRQALAAPVSNFLNGHDIVVVQKLEISAAEAKFLSGGESNLMGAMATGMLKRGYPDKEKCMKIMDWLTTKPSDN